MPLSAGKAADEKLLFFLDSEGDKQASTVRVLLGKDIKFNGILPHETVQFSRAHLSVGGDNFVGMGLGFSVSADLEHLDYTLWQQFIGDLMNGLPDGNDAILSPPQRIFIESETAGIFGKKFDNVEILAKNRETLWELQIDADQARAEAILHKEWFDKGIELQADFIKIDKSEVLLTKAATAARDGVSSIAFPPLKVKCDHCSYHGYDIGKIELEMSRTDPGMSIDRLQVQLRDGRIDASGNWYISESSESTRLQGTFNSDDLGAFLKTLNFDSGIRDSDASMEFDLSWQDAPYAFTTESLGGGIDWRLGDGYLTEISDKGARLLSLLSLESLLRKLTLDFRDVFAKGFFYENMRGSFQLSDGLVSTEDTFIDGAAAGVTLKGNTDLNNNELNYLVNVSPKLTSNLPVLIAWMVNPATAVAALAFDEVFTSADVVSGIQYSLTGSLKEPQITLLEQTSRVVELPAQNRLSKPKSLPDNEASDELPGSSENGQYPYRQPPVEPIEQPQIQQESES